MLDSTKDILFYVKQEITNSDIFITAFYLGIMLLFFIFVMRVIHFFMLKQDPIQAIVPKKLHWFMKKVQDEKIRKHYEENG